MKNQNWLQKVLDCESLKEQLRKKDLVDQIAKGVDPTFLSALALLKSWQRLNLLIFR